MEKYNKVYLVLWLLFSAVTLSFMLVFVLSALAEILDEANVTLSFFLLFLTSEIIGFAIASLAIDRIIDINGKPWNLVSKVASKS